MKRLLLLSLLALPLTAQYPAGAVFQRGDDPRWADPGFDDRQWVKQSDYRANSYDDYLQNRSWMRARVTIPAGEPAVIVSQHCPCEFYVNGLRVAAIGDLNPPRPYTPREIRIFPLPAGIAPGDAVFAVRRYDPPGQESIVSSWGGSSALLAPASGADQALEQFAKTILAPSRFLVLVVLFALAALLGATWGQRKDAAFWVALSLQGCALLSQVLLTLVSIGSADQSNIRSIGLSFAVPNPILPAILLVLIVPGVNRRLWLSACLLATAIRVPSIVALYYGVPPSWLPLAVPASEAGSLLIVVTAWALMTLALRLGGIPRPLLLFCALGPVCSLLTRLAPTLQLPRQFVVFEVNLSWNRLAQLFYSLTVAALVIWRAQVRRRQELRQQEELAAAQEVQSLLLASPYQANPHLQIETAYLPASGVGGDFYYVRDFADGSQVALVGDVSGKGLKAAMVVSACIGSLQREDSSSPAAILMGLNRTLAGRVGGGFVTCCCVQYIPGGTVTVASAGHPAPWLDGREVALTAGLPLGIVAHAEFEESRIPLAHGQQLTLVSDGVVEAENASRELFGFDRTRDISTKSAQEIANAAQAWGQTDDITVVTVTRGG